MAEREDADLYNRVFYAWTQDQAARLRALGRDNRFDVAHVANEIEDLGRSQLNTVASHLEKLLMHLIKLAWSPATAPRAHWRQEVLEHQSEAQRTFSEAMRRNIDLDRIWRKAIQRARMALIDRGEPALPIPAKPPFELDTLLDDAFDADAAEACVRASLRHDAGSS